MIALIRVEYLRALLGPFRVSAIVIALAAALTSNPIGVIWVCSNKIACAPPWFIIMYTIISRNVSHPAQYNI